MNAVKPWVPVGAFVIVTGLLVWFTRRAGAARLPAPAANNAPDGPAPLPVPVPVPVPQNPLPPQFALPRYAPSAPETIALFEAATRVAGLPVAWARATATHQILQRESGGVVGRVNYTYGNKPAETVWRELRAGYKTAPSSATGLGQLLLANVDRYYPDGRVGIGDALNEAVGMLRYIKAAYGSPACAWWCYGGKHAGQRCVATRRRCHAHEGY